MSLWTLAQTYRSMNRMREIVIVLSRHGFSQVLQATGLSRLAPMATRLRRGGGEYLGDQHAGAAAPGARRPRPHLRQAGPDARLPPRPGARPLRRGIREAARGRAPLPLRGGAQDRGGGDGAAAGGGLRRVRGNPARRRLHGAGAPRRPQGRHEGWSSRCAGRGSSGSSPRTSACSSSSSGPWKSTSPKAATSISP